MAEPDQSADKLLVAVQNDTACVRVVGRGSFKISTSLKHFAVAAFDQGCDKLLVDMTGCLGMDSTFMGVLAGLAGRLRPLGTKPVLVNLSTKTRQLLGTLGLNHIIESHLVGELPDDYRGVFAPDSSLEQLAVATEERRETAETMLEAHEELVEVSAANAPRFKDVIQFLREDLDRAGSNEVTGG